ncbi:DNA polymerase-3 subunit delta' [Alteromonadaceae bacterium 2753L.S.0a.02]|nr:DNA polymerase-3 subunit delta' [Alteromonadaceae bacterium 2753L.S.0a.02]
MNPTSVTMPPYPWQMDYWASFLSQLQRGKLPHAILIAGIPGIGIEALGRAIADYLLCASPLEMTSCGRCKACQLIASNNHPDLFILAPEEKSNVIKVDQVRVLTEFVAKTSQQGGRKLIVINPAEAMNISAANALLKCLEEPAGDTTFVLVSTANNRLMPTIRSRCATHVLGVPKQQEAVAWLKQMEVGEPEALLEEALGAPLKAHEWWRSKLIQDRNEMCGLLAGVLSGQKTASAVAAQWASRYGALEVSQLFVFWLERLLRARVTEPRSIIMEHWQDLVDVNSAVSDQMLFRLLEGISQRRSQLLGNPNLNAGMVVEELLLDWMAVVKGALKRKIGGIAP